MKRIALLFAMLLILASCAPGTPGPSAGESEPSVVEAPPESSEPQAPPPQDEGLIADRFLRHLADEDYEAAFELCGAEMKATFSSADGVRAAWDGVLALTGAFAAIDEPRSENQVFYFPASFANGRFMLQVAEQDGLVTGFFCWAGLGIAEQYAEDFFSGNYEEVFAQSDEDMQAYFGSAEGVAAVAEQMSLISGAYLSHRSPVSAAGGEYVNYTFPVQYEQGAFDLKVTVRGDRVAGFGITNSAAENRNAVALRDGPAPSEDLPAGVAEEDIFLNKDGERPLHGKLTYPAGAAEPLPVVVLVQGSGAHDLDETIGGNTPFKDIAYALSARGIAVLRYNKATYAYPNDPVETIRAETTDDAVAAKKALMEQSALTFSKFFVAGHSLGGMMAPRIASEGGYDGMIILAGSPRSLVDIVYDQARYLVPLEESMTGEQKQLALADYEAKYTEALSLMELPAEELEGKTMLGFSAVYIHSMEHPDRNELLLSLGLPTLILQGGKDFQVYADKDFAAYREMTKGLSNVECILYDNLNHLFMPSTMETPTTQEYNAPATVDARVTGDMARWVLGNAA